MTFGFRSLLGNAKRNGVRRDLLLNLICWFFSFFFFFNTRAVYLKNIQLLFLISTASPCRIIFCNKQCRTLSKLFNKPSKLLGYLWSRIRSWGLCHRCYGGTGSPLVPTCWAKAFGKDEEVGEGCWLTYRHSWMNAFLPSWHWGYWLSTGHVPAPLEPGFLQPGQPTQQSPGAQRFWCLHIPPQPLFPVFWQTHWRNKGMKDELGSGILLLSQYPACPLQHCLWDPDRLYLLAELRAWCLVLVLRWSLHVLQKQRGEMGPSQPQHPECCPTQPESPTSPGKSLGLRCFSLCSFDLPLPR